MPSLPMQFTSAAQFAQWFPAVDAALESMPFDHPLKAPRRGTGDVAGMPMPPRFQPVMNGPGDEVAFRVDQSTRSHFGIPRTLTDPRDRLGFGGLPPITPPRDGWRSLSPADTAWLARVTNEASARRDEALAVADDPSVTASRAKQARALAARMTEYVQAGDSGVAIASAAWLPTLATFTVPEPFVPASAPTKIGSW